mgnify:CR=1 FL=1
MCGGRPRYRLVLLKLYAPPAKLEAEAERIGLRMRLRQGGFCAFHRSLRSHFAGSGDASSVFRSSERQVIIDHVLRSRCDAGGAGLLEATPLGATIVARFPLHMRARLAQLEPWLRPWTAAGPGVVTDLTVAQRARARIDRQERDARRRRQERLLRQMQQHPGGAWGPAAAAAVAAAVGADANGHCGEGDVEAPAAAASTSTATAAAGAAARRDGYSYEVEADDAGGALGLGGRNTLAGGCAAVGHFVSSFFSQPLDEIAEYFGEQTAFYFAWLEFYTKVRNIGSNNACNGFSLLLIRIAI